MDGPLLEPSAAEAFDPKRKCYKEKNTKKAF
jgi:hypothetical protein